MSFCSLMRQSKGLLLLLWLVVGRGLSSTSMKGLFLTLIPLKSQWLRLRPRHYQTLVAATGLSSP